MAHEPEKTNDSCLRCGRPLYTFGVQEFRLEGTTGGWSRAFGQLVEPRRNIIGSRSSPAGLRQVRRMRIPDQGA